MNNLQIIERSNQRVLTTQQLAEAYGTNARRISENFNNNSSRYTEGKHFILLINDDLKVFKYEYDNSVVAKTASSLYLWTEKGAWLHAKSLNTNQAWDAYEMLVDDYYTIKTQQLGIVDKYLSLNEEDRAIAYFTELKEKRMIKEQLLIAMPKVEKYEQFINSDGLLDMKSLAKIVGWGRNTLFAFMRENKLLMKDNTPYQQYVNRGYFKLKAKSTPIGVKHVTLVTPKGADYIAGLINKAS
ncbi:phage antirepressor KilAC domain-containing protein [Cytobacillus sp. FSL H8-0458]|uniref:phage antirepressor KilAC domain-containing protein n=1 Tax=Cytobacillus sp. FSL H8-0458 TaxID=2975346 RepID=UPI0030FC5D52